MAIGEVSLNILLMVLCYAYILFIIFISSKMERLLGISRKISRKFLHVMIGNFPFIIPFFTANIFPVLVAAPFIAVTFLASPYSPFKSLSQKMKGLASISEGGHGLGLVFYAIAYTLLALFFASKPEVIAAGILPMAYGDAAASLIGERFGKRKYKVIANKSLEGSVAMFIAGFSSFTLCLIFFSLLYSFQIFNKIFVAIGVATVTTVVEAFSPMGFDNLTVPAAGALAYLLLCGGV
ncbi:MAG: phosphatidate cytidylyltransferase [Candidatus Bathyarchaeia archaeon]